MLDLDEAGNRRDGGQRHDIAGIEGADRGGFTVDDFPLGLRGQENSLDEGDQIQVISSGAAVSDCFWGGNEPEGISRNGKR